MFVEVLRAARAASPTLCSWQCAGDMLVRIEGDWLQSLSLQRDKSGGGTFFANHAVECIAIRDRVGIVSTRIGERWSKRHAVELGAAFVAQAQPTVSQPLDSAAMRAQLPATLRPAAGKFHDDSDPRALLVLAVLSVRALEREPAITAIARAAFTQHRWAVGRLGSDRLGQAARGPSSRAGSMPRIGSSIMRAHSRSTSSASSTDYSIAK